MCIRDRAAIARRGYFRLCGIFVGGFLFRVLFGSSVQSGLLGFQLLEFLLCRLQLRGELACLSLIHILRE